MDLEQRARAYALEKHKEQKYGALPYEYHLRQVVEIVYYPNETPAEILAAAWLHDVVEDTDATLHDIRTQFGGNVARIVDICTDEPGKNRKERKAKSYEKLRTAPPMAKRVKLADRIANMKASIENPDLAKMYRREFPDFIRAIGSDESNYDLIVEAFYLYMNSVESQYLCERCECLNCHKQPCHYTNDE